MERYVHQHKDWPDLTWENDQLAHALASVRYRQGRFLGRMEALGFAFRSQAGFQTLNEDVLKTSAIEGEFLDPAQVRSSVARQLGLKIEKAVPSEKKVDGAVAMIFDATRHFNKKLSKTRLCNWQYSLFPGGYSGNYKVRTGNWRNSPVQVVSGAMGKERVHFEGPPAAKIEKEMKRFLKWYNGENVADPVLKAGVAHFWFVTVHPFEDGNGRIARALTDMMLARADETPQRFYSMSAQILRERKSYYEILEKSQRGKTDITAWLRWFLYCLGRGIEASEQTLSGVLNKAKFWEEHTSASFNPRQKLMLNKLFDGFEGKLVSSKWAKICKCSPDTALRDIRELMELHVLEKEKGGGRSTGYRLRNAE